MNLEAIKIEKICARWKPNCLKCFNVIYTCCTTDLSNLQILTFRGARTKKAAPKDHAGLNSSDDAVWHCL